MSKPSEVEHPLREEVYHFAMIMEGRLQEHEDRGGWRDEPLDYLFKRLVEEMGELSAALLGHKDKEKMIRECADVANFAMMIADDLRHASARSPNDLHPLLCLPIQRLPGTGRAAGRYWPRVLRALSDMGRAGEGA